MAATSITSTGLPANINNYSQDALKDVSGFLKSGNNYVYGTKPGESLYTPLSDMQNEAIGNIDWLANQDLADMFGINMAGNAYKDIGESARSDIFSDFQRYMNPYIDEVLQPQIREINENLQRGRRDLGANAAMSGAFGDARHGIMEGELYRGANEAIGDVTGEAYRNAFDNALGTKFADLQRRMTGNAASAQGLSQLGNQYLSMFTDVNDALFNAGEIERNAEIERTDAIRNFQEALKNKKYDDAMKMLAAINGTPYETTQTTTQKSNDGLMGIVGSVLGSLF